MGEHSFNGAEALYKPLVDPESAQVTKNNPEQERMEQWSLIQLHWAQIMCAKLFEKLPAEELEAEVINWLTDDTHSDWFRKTFKLDPKKQELISEYKEHPKQVLDTITEEWKATHH